LTKNWNLVYTKVKLREIVPIIIRENMHITELAKITGASVDELRYMERKGFINAARAKIKKREVRQYRDGEMRKVKLIVKYRRLGFTWDAAYQKARRELENPPLFEG